MFKLSKPIEKFSLNNNEWTFGAFQLLFQRFSSQIYHFWDMLHQNYGLRTAPQTLVNVVVEFVYTKIILKNNKIINSQNLLYSSL